MTKKELVKKLELIDTILDELEGSPIYEAVKDIRDVREKVSDLISEVESDEDQN